MKILETERLILREFQTNDINRLALIYSDSEVMKFIGKGETFNFEKTGKNIDAWINKYYKEWGFGIWAITDKYCNKLIGQCGFNILKENSEIEIAYLLAKEYWGKGYATEISKATLEYGFEKLKLQKIVALVYTENKDSIKVLKKLGMNPEGEKEFFGVKFYYYSLAKIKNKN